MNDLLLTPYVIYTCLKIIIYRCTMWSLKSSLLIVDLFRRPILVFSEKNKYRSTNIGVIFSLFIYILLFYLLITSNMAEKRSPQITDHAVETKSRPEIKLNSPVIFDVCDENSISFFDPTIFTINASVIHLTTNTKTKNGKKLIGEDQKLMRECREDDFAPGVFEEMGFKNKYCMDNKTITMKGYWDEQDISFTYIWLSRCVNGTSDIVCKSPEEIDQFLKLKYMSIYITNPFIDMSDFNDPIKKLWKNEANYIDPSLRKSFIFYLKKVEFIDDKGWFQSSANYVETYSFDRRETDYLFEKQSDVFFDITFYSSILVQKKVRLFQKLSEVIAYIGGICQILMLLGYIITYPQFLLLSIQSTMSYLFILYKDGITKEKPLTKPSIEFTEGDSDKLINIADEKQPNDKDLEIEIKKREKAPFNANHGTPKEIKQEVTLNSRNFQTLSALAALRIDMFDSKVPSPGRIKKIKGGHCEIEKLETNSEDRRSTGKQSLINFENKVSFSLFSLPEYYRYSIKKLFKLSFSEREKNFLKVEEQFQKEVNLANILGRLLILERYMIDSINKEKSKTLIRQKHSLRNYSASCLLHKY